MRLFRAKTDIALIALFEQYGAESGYVLRREQRQEGRERKNGGKRHERGRDRPGPGGRICPWKNGSVSADCRF